MGSQRILCLRSLHRWTYGSVYQKIKSMWKLNSLAWGSLLHYTYCGLFLKKKRGVTVNIISGKLVAFCGHLIQKMDTS